MTTQLPERDGDGYLTDMGAWTPEIGRAMADADNFPISDDMWNQINLARDIYLKTDSVPPIRKFIKFIGADKKEIFKQWNTGPMKPITKYGGLPKPTGCV
jgi:tRNA 2-thiouridine synthesizing protein E